MTAVLQIQMSADSTMRVVGRDDGLRGDWLELYGPRRSEQSDVDPSGSLPPLWTFAYAPGALFDEAGSHARSLCFGLRQQPFGVGVVAGIRSP